MVKDSDFDGFRYERNGRCNKWLLEVVLNVRKVNVCGGQIITRMPQKIK